GGEGDGGMDDGGEDDGGEVGGEENDHDRTPIAFAGPQGNTSAVIDSTSIPVVGGNWNFFGPGSINNGQVTGAAAPVSGRIVAVAAHPTDPNTIYIAAAGGGVWKTVNSGASWTQLTDSQTTLFMGSIAVSKSDPNVIYAGTGEPNNAIDCQYGRGVLKSLDGGASWTLMGNSNFNGQAIS